MWSKGPRRLRRPENERPIVLFGWRCRGPGSPPPHMRTHCGRRFASTCHIASVPSPGPISKRAIIGLAAVAEAGGRRKVGLSPPQVSRVSLGCLVSY